MGKTAVEAGWVVAVAPCYNEKQLIEYVIFLVTVWKFKMQW